MGITRIFLVSLVNQQSKYVGKKQKIKNHYKQTTKTKSANSFYRVSTKIALLNLIFLGQKKPSTPCGELYW